jgi:hypothetical protein
VTRVAALLTGYATAVLEGDEPNRYTEPRRDLDVFDEIAHQRAAREIVHRSSTVANDCPAHAEGLTGKDGR